MPLERSMQRIAHQAPKADPLVRDTQELARCALDIGGSFLRAVWAGFSDPGDSGTIRKRTGANTAVL